MKTAANPSLSTKVTLISAGVTVVLFAGIFLLFASFSKTALLQAEKEKAQTVAETVAPMLAVDLYLGLKEHLASLGREIMRNPEILRFTIREGNQTVLSLEQKRSEGEARHDDFRVSQPIVHPVTGRKIALLELRYSSAHYRQLLEQYNKIMLVLLLLLVVISLLYALYLRHLLRPLKTVAEALRRFRPGKTLQLPEADSDDEIGSITAATRQMAERLNDYARKQKEIERSLAEEVRKKTAQLERHYYTDSLTQLPNRIRLIHDLLHAERGVLAVVDIDGFGQINDLYGYPVGDAVLQKVGRLLKQRQHEFSVYKLAADEFALFSDLPVPFNYFEQFLQEQVAMLESEFFSVDDVTLGLQVTAGAVIGTQKALEKADIALKVARSKQLPFVIYDEHYNVEEGYRDNLRLLQLLKTAVSEDRVALYLQPIFDTVSGEKVGSECLMRLVGDGGKLLLPHAFLPFAKQSRYYSILSRAMISKSFRYFSYRPEPFSINLSVDDILDIKTAAFIRQELVRYDVASRVTFELLESEKIESYPEVGLFIRELKAMGCRFAIDDFGSGYSNFEHLLRLDIDAIKIDGTLIRNVDHDENARLVVETIVNFARKKSLKCVAEFVHSEEVLRVVRELGIEFSQGFYLGEPAPAEEQRVL